jgi:hypothetical protein
MSEYEIIKGAPPPPAKGRTSAYPFADMEVGDAFDANSEAVRWSVYAYGKRHGKKFAVRSVGNGVLRVWRTA